MSIISCSKGWPSPPWLVSIQLITRVVRSPVSSTTQRIRRVSKVMGSVGAMRIMLSLCARASRGTTAAGRPW